MRKILFATLLAAGIAGPGAAAEGPKAPAQDWSFGGLFGTFDPASAQRGFQVYKEVCAACHGLYHVSYRNLAEIGFNEDEVKAIAAQATVRDGPNDQGEMFDRPGRPSDKFVRPFANEKAARATNNGAYPPDLSLITKARADGANYLYGLLTGYGDPPPGVAMGEGMSWNKYFPGHQIAMPPPLNANSVTYSDGTPSGIEQMSKDVVTFLAWTAEPEMEERKRTGAKVILFLLVLTGLLYAVKRKVWAAVH